MVSSQWLEEKWEFVELRIKGKVIEDPLPVGKCLVDAFGTIAAGGCDLFRLIAYVDSTE